MSFGLERARNWQDAGRQKVCDPQGDKTSDMTRGYLYAAMNPASGDLFGLLLPSMTVESRSLFVREFRLWLTENGEAEAETLLVLDGAGAHRSERVSYGLMEKELLPPYSPELNRVERFFQELRRELKNKVYESYEEVEKAVEELFKKYLAQPETVKKLTNFHWLHTIPTY